MNKFLKSQQGIDKVLQTETDRYDQVAADKRLKNAKWLSDLVLRKIEKTLKDVEIAQMQMELKARGAFQYIEEYIKKKVDAATEDIKREIS